MPVARIADKVKRRPLRATPAAASVATQLSEGQASVILWDVRANRVMASSSLISPGRISLPRNCGRVGLHIVLFEIP